MEQINPDYSVGSNPERVSLLTQGATFLFAVGGAAILTLITKSVFSQTEYSFPDVASLGSFQVAFFFGVIAVLPLLFFLGQRAFVIKIKILSFIFICSMSQVVAVVGALTSVIPIFLFALLVEVISGFKALESWSFIPALFVPLVVGTWVIVLSLQTLFPSIYSISKKDILLLIGYDLFFPISLSFVIDTASFGSFASFSSHGAIDRTTFLTVSFFWQTGMLYFVGRYFAYYAMSLKKSQERNDPSDNAN